MSGLLEIWAKYYKEGRGVCNSSRMISLVFLYKGWDSYSKCMRMGNFCHVLEFECAGARIWLPLLLSSEFLPGRRLSVMLMQLLVQPLFFFRPIFPFYSASFFLHFQRTRSSAFFCVQASGRYRYRPGMGLFCILYILYS